MGFINHSIDFLVASAVILPIWLVYLWANNRISMITIPALKEILGALASIGLFAVLSVILYFFSLALAMGIITILSLVALAYVARKTRKAISAE